MAADKPKIDLKARLGRKSGAPEAMPGPAVGGAPFGAPMSSPPPGGGFGGPPGGAPAPSGFPGGMPPAAAPQMGGMPGPGQQPMARPPVGVGPAPGPRPATPGMSSIPAPPGFGPKAPMQQAPVAAQAASAPMPMQQPIRQASIKLEMGEEVAEARRQGRSKIYILTAGVFAVALGIGYGIGGLSEANKGAEAALVGSKALIEDITAANAKATEMSDLLKKAAATLKGGKYPSEEIEQLGALDIPFDGKNLMNKNIGRFNQTATTMLFQYTTAVANAEDQKDKVRRLFGGMKSAWEAGAAQKAKPTVRFGITVASSNNGPVASISPIKSFAASEKWPSDVEVGDKKKSRYDGGDPTKGDGALIPLEPGGESAVCPENPINVRLMGALLDTARDLAGDNTPGQEKPGLLDTGTKLIDQLKKIGAAPQPEPGK